jgi:hypothetical protein
MSWTRGAKGVARFGTSCLADILLWFVVAPGLALLLVIAEDTGDPAWILGAAALAVLAFALYLLASWD